MVKVRVIRSFRNAAYGSREKGEHFEYDFDKDPGHLRRDGFVELPPAAKPAPGKAGE